MMASHRANGANVYGSSDPINEQPPWPQLAPAALHGLAGEIVRAATINSEADPAAVLATVLAHAGIVAGRGPRVRVTDDFHHARLFCAIVGQSARGRKGTSEAPIRRIWDVAVLSGCEPLNWKPGPMSSGEGLIAAIRDGDGQEDGDPGVADKRLFIVEGEFAAPLRAMQRQGNTLSTFIRSAWDGRTLEPLTKGDPIKATDPHIGIVAHITMAELDTLLSKVELFNGFANRFLWFVVRRSKLVPLAAGMSNSDVDRLGREYGARLRAAASLGEMEFSDDARELYCNLYPELTADQSGLYGVVTARAEAQVIRIALTFALLDASPLITTQHVVAAIAVWDYCDGSARYLFGAASVDPTETRILAALGGGPKSTTDLHHALGGHAERKELHDALKNLQERGRIDRMDQPTPGRPRTVWCVRVGFETAKEANYAN
jgi:hypothetical protein